MRAAPLPLADVLEKAWDAQLFGSKEGLATTLGWTLSYHVLRSKGSRSGFPDRVLVKDRVIYAELKREKTRPSTEQIRWLNGLANAGAEAYLWKPSDLDEIARILSKRWTRRDMKKGDPWLVPTSAVGDGLCVPIDAWWQPRSIWVPGIGRADEGGNA